RLGAAAPVCPRIRLLAQPPLPQSAAGGALPAPERHFTFLLPAGRRECFYQGAPGGGSMEAEYQVIGGAGLDIDFSLESPSGVLLINEYRKSDGVHTGPGRWVIPKSPVDTDLAWYFFLLAAHSTSG
uniref:GOLD domain-containing protein n=1 Tax=Gopherus agassizii TaxID=38772 RepID=A0A452I623_9SAUR